MEAIIITAIIAVLIGLVIVFNEAVFASDYTCPIYGGRDYKDAINPIKWVTYLIAHSHKLIIVLAIITGCIIWGYFVFFPAYAIMRYARSRTGKFTTDADWIELK